MAAFAALGLFADAIAVGGRGFYVWNHCGYDCAAVPYLGLSASAAMLLGVVLAAIGIALLLGVLLEKGE
jgi:hypothetical protein